MRPTFIESVLLVVLEVIIIFQEISFSKADNVLKESNIATEISRTCSEKTQISSERCCFFLKSLKHIDELIQEGEVEEKSKIQVEEGKGNIPARNNEEEIKCLLIFGIGLVFAVLINGGSSAYNILNKRWNKIRTKEKRKRVKDQRRHGLSKLEITIERSGAETVYRF